MFLQGLCSPKVGSECVLNTYQELCDPASGVQLWPSTCGKLWNPYQPKAFTLSPHSPMTEKS